MSNILGSKLRHVATVKQASRVVSVVYLDCGHLAVREGHLAAGQRVFCRECVRLTPHAHRPPSRLRLALEGAGFLLALVACIVLPGVLGP